RDWSSDVCSSDHPLSDTSRVSCQSSTMPPALDCSGPSTPKRSTIATLAFRSRSSAFFRRHAGHDGLTGKYFWRLGADPDVLPLLPRPLARSLYQWTTALP